MMEHVATPEPADKLLLELRRGTLALAVLSQLRSPRYGYSLLERLAEHGLEIEQGTLYPLLRRLDEQGLLDSRWEVEEPRPRKYYRLSPAGAATLETLRGQWSRLVGVLAVLLTDEAKGDQKHGSD